MKNTIIKTVFLSGIISINLSAMESYFYDKEVDSQEKYNAENSDEFLNPVTNTEYTPGDRIGFSSINSNASGDSSIKFTGTPTHKDFDSYRQNLEKEAAQERLQRSLELSNLLFSERVDKLQACLDLMDLCIEQDPYIQSIKYIKELLKKYTKV